MSCDIWLRQDVICGLTCNEDGTKCLQIVLKSFSPNQNIQDVVRVCVHTAFTRKRDYSEIFRKMCFSSLQKWWKSFSQIYICLKISEKWLLVICNMSQNHRNQVRRSIISGFYVFLVLPLFFGSCIGSSSCLVDPLENPEGKEEVSLIDKLVQNIALAKEY